MKKNVLVFLGTISLCSVMAFSYVSKVSATETSSASQKIDWNAEKKKALAAGYTEAQFNAIMKEPKVVPEEDVSQFYENPDSKIQSHIQIQNKSTSQQNSVVQWARKQIGKPYEWGKYGPGSFDCGGLVKFVYKNAVNISLPMGTYNQEKFGKEVSLNSLEPGDLLFWGARGSTYHVAIYIGNNQYIHAPQPGQNVCIGSLDWWIKPSFARRLLSDNPTDPNIPTTTGQKQGEQYIFRLYNPNAGQHHYTGDVNEAKKVKNAGWRYEGVGWVSSTTGANLYRLYNPNSGEHFYTLDAKERDNLKKAGWYYECIAWHSKGSMPVYRLFNPNAHGNQESHFYTLNASERNNLVKHGWRYECVAWYALRFVK